jgi:hypothetical protein
MLAAFVRALRDGGRLDEPDLVREIERNGFRKVSEREHIIGSQHIVVFEKK